MTHTPGPWRRQVIAPHFEMTAIQTADGKKSIGRVNAGVEGKANAHLIAAAPDLLAALTAVIGDFDHAGLRGLIHKHWGAEKEISMRQSIAQAKAAIAKAKGA